MEENIKGSSLRDKFYILLQSTVEFFEQYGWPILFAVLLVLIIRPHLLEYMQKLSLAHANRASRRKVLDEEVQRIRERQQEEYINSVRDANISEKSKSAQKPKKTPEEEEEAAKALAALISNYKKNYINSKERNK